MENIEELFAEWGLWGLVEDISDDGDGEGDDLQLTKEGLEAERMIDQLLSERRKETLQEIFEWNELQIKRWEKEGFNKDFRNGVQSGYGWSNQHIEHLITRKECKCPI